MERMCTRLSVKFFSDKNPRCPVTRDQVAVLIRTCLAVPYGALSLLAIWRRNQRFTISEMHRFMKTVIMPGLTNMKMLQDFFSFFEGLLEPPTWRALDLSTFREMVNKAVVALCPVTARCSEIEETGPLDSDLIEQMKSADVSVIELRELLSLIFHFVSKRIEGTTVKTVSDFWLHELRPDEALCQETQQARIKFACDVVGTIASPESLLLYQLLEPEVAKLTHDLLQIRFYECETRRRFVEIESLRVASAAETPMRLPAIDDVPDSGSSLTLRDLANLSTSGRLGRLHIILETINSRRRLNCAAFCDYCSKTADLFVSLYPWYYMPVTVHKVLIRGADVVENTLSVPIGSLSEEAQEAMNKIHRGNRLGHSRKISRSTTNEDVFHEMLVLSDPYIRSFGSQSPETEYELDEDLQYLLKNCDANGSDSE
ncbi:uncharacterized protein LOC108865011 [Galendromus occidentalis]|uniref:Uncharacterized protein LOC108865011 n=1 Tax=Galendromus occidentalis TaxID=34638 RepID=A0AAJ7L6A2_9ACAR|nr:uncharacterized protein LOC108865011 [Galendromus occidentalis]